MAFTTTAKENLFKLLFGQASNNLLLSTCYLGLSTTQPTEAGDNFTEPSSGDGYARSLLGTYNASTTHIMGITSNYTEENKSIIYFPEATSSWGTITHWGLFLAASGGKPLLYGALSSPVAVPANNVPLFRVGSFTMSVS